MKRCYKCKAHKPLDAFHRDKYAKDGRYGFCRECNKRKKRGSILQRFFSKVSVTSNCWLWLGSRDGCGYGSFGVGGKKLIKAHRFAYEIQNGFVPNGLQLDHLCRVRHCVNPWHLEIVTQRENILRGISPSAQCARQTHCLRGHPLSGNNLYEFGLKKGQRLCKECHHDYMKTWRSNHVQA